MASESITDEIREKNLRTLRIQIDKCSVKLLLSAVQKELGCRKNSFVYNLFLNNILFAGKL